MCGVHHNGHSFKSHNPTSIVLLIIFTIIIKRKQNNSLSPFPRSPYRGPSPPVTIVFPANIFYIVPIIASSKSTASLRNFYCDSTQKMNKKNGGKTTFPIIFSLIFPYYLIIFIHHCIIYCASDNNTHHYFKTSISTSLHTIILKKQLAPY